MFSCEKYDKNYFKVNYDCLRRCVFRIFQKNVGLKVLNLSWNGFAKEGAICLGRALEENRTLKTLDISNNRIGIDGIGGFLKGLQQNDGLSTLKVTIKSLCHIS